MGWDRPKPKGPRPIFVESSKTLDSPQLDEHKVYRDQRRSNRKHRRYERNQTRAYEDIVLAKKRIAQLILDPFDLQRFFPEEYIDSVLDDDLALQDNRAKTKEEKIETKFDALVLKKNVELQRKVEELESKLIEIEKPSWAHS